MRLCLCAPTHSTRRLIRVSLHTSLGCTHTQVVCYCTLIYLTRTSLHIALWVIAHQPTVHTRSGVCCCMVAYHTLPHVLLHTSLQLTYALTCVLFHTSM